MDFENLLIEQHGPVAVIRLHRPKQMNALNDALMDELGVALRRFDADDAVGCIVLTGSEKAFAAGADISSMVDKTYLEVAAGGLISRNWEIIQEIRKPVIAAVAGYALGGGCELAMMCDVIIAGESAKFGQPEIRLGIIPGAGGTQRLPRWIGKSKAMDLVLTGRTMGANEAERAGLVSRVVSDSALLEEAIAAGMHISAFPRFAVAVAKQAVNRAYETTLGEGLRAERQAFHALFATEDQKEGMRAFLEKRPPHFTGR